MIVARDVEILLIEPDPAEARAATAILKRSRVRNHVTVAATAAQATAHLRRQGGQFRAPRPNLILLSADRLPDRGRKLLGEIKTDRHLLHIPVVFLSGSEAEADIKHAYDLDANCYVRKPLEEEQLNRVLETAREFWLSVAQLPFD